MTSSFGLNLYPSLLHPLSTDVTSRSPLVPSLEVSSEQVTVFCNSFFLGLYLLGKLIPSTFLNILL